MHRETLTINTFIKTQSINILLSVDKDFFIWYDKGGHLTSVLSYVVLIQILMLCAVPYNS